MKLLAITASVFIAVQTPSVAQEFAPDAEVQAPALEMRWPPIDEPSFRASLLDFLQRHPSARMNSGKDILPELSTSMGRFCNLPPSDRFRFVMLEFVDFVSHAKVEDGARRRLRADCGLAIYTHEQDGARSFIAIYSRPIGAQPIGQAYEVKNGTARLQVVAVPAPANSPHRFRAAARKEALRLARAQEP